MHQLVNNQNISKIVTRFRLLETRKFNLTTDSAILQDNFNRNHNYLRISLTERCNLRCKIRIFTILV